MSYLQANLNQLQALHPALYGELCNGSVDEELQWRTSNGGKTLLCSGIQLTSAYDRQGEAALQASSLVQKDSRSATVYGVAFGDLPRELLRRQCLVKLRVVVLNTIVLRQCFRAVDHTEWLSDPRVELLTVEGENEVQYPFVVAPAMLRLVEPEGERLRDSIVRELSKSHQERHTRSLAPVLDAQQAKNLPRLEEDGDVASLFNAAAGRTAVVVAGGPTAIEQFARLSASREEYWVVAASTALLPLLGAHVVPDAVVAIDPHPGIADHFRGAARELVQSIPLVYLPTVHPDALDTWGGVRLVTYVEDERCRTLARKIPKTFLYCEGTVTHVVVDLAVRSGAKTVLLVGVDFCFAKGQSHVTGAAGAWQLDPVEAQSRPTVVNGLGERTASQSNLIGYLRELEEYIFQHPGVRFLNTGRQGATIAGAPWLEG